MRRKRYKFKDFFGFLSTPVGRMQLQESIYQFLWPFIAPLAALWRRVFLPKVCVICIVGSYGKTTTMRAISAIFGEKIQTRVCRNSLSFLAGKLLKTKPSKTAAVIEVGIDKPGQMKRYAKIIRPDITVVTSIGSEHNRSLGTLQETRREKAEMVRILSLRGAAVLNGDDPNVSWMRSQTKAKVITYGISSANDIYASDISLSWPTGVKFTLHAQGKERLIQTKLIGRTMIYPILAAVAVAWVKKLDLDRIVCLLQELEPTLGRLQPIAIENGAYILSDDFKSSFETIHVALDELSQIPAQRKIVVMGEISEPPGSQGWTYRDIGRRMAGVASRIIIVGRNFQRYAAEVRRVGFSNSDLINAGNNIHKAIEILRSDLEPQDVVLIKGRDNQRLERIWLALNNRVVNCQKTFCGTKVTRCDDCPMLERG